VIRVSGDVDAPKYLEKTNAALVLALLVVEAASSGSDQQESWQLCLDSFLYGST
jgi:hypothetical protein